MTDTNPNQQGPQTDPYQDLGGAKQTRWWTDDLTSQAGILPGSFVFGGTRMHIVDGKPRPCIVYCPRRRQHNAECETPDSCAGGIDCRLGPDLDSQRAGEMVAYWAEEFLSALEKKWPEVTDMDDEREALLKAISELRMLKEPTP